MPGVGSYNTTPALNTSINGIDISEGCAPGGYNNALRQIMADIATWTATNGVTYPVTIANGGTGQTSASAALAALGGLALAYRDLPVTTQAAAFAFADANRGGGINYTGAAAAATINPNATTAITTGGFIVVRNNGTGVLTLTPGAGVSLKKNGATVSGTAALAIGGVATLVKWGTDDWTVSGTGIS